MSKICENCSFHTTDTTWDRNQIKCSGYQRCCLFCLWRKNCEDNFYHQESLSPVTVYGDAETCNEPALEGRVTRTTIENHQICFFSGYRFLSDVPDLPYKKSFSLTIVNFLMIHFVTDSLDSEKNLHSGF